jgi:flagellar biogenesis protein FliO
VLLAIVGTLKYLLPWLAKSGAAPALFANAGLPQIDALGKVRQVIPLGAHRQLYVVEVGDRVLVLSSLPNQLQLISEMPLSALQGQASEPAYAEAPFSVSRAEAPNTTPVETTSFNTTLKQNVASPTEQDEAITLEVLRLQPETKAAARNSASSSVKAVKPRLQAAHPGHKRWEDERLQAASTAVLGETDALDENPWHSKNKPIWFVPPTEAVVIQLQDYEDDF